MVLIRAIITPRGPYYDRRRVVLIKAIIALRGSINLFIVPMTMRNNQLRYA